MFEEFELDAEQLNHIEQAVRNPYLSNVEKGFELMTNLIARPSATTSQQDKKEALRAFRELLETEFVTLIEKEQHPLAIQTYRELVQLADSLDELIVFPTLVNKTVIGVGGGFSAGKSRFINSLLQTDVLPEALEPTTSIPTYITSSSTESESIVSLNLFDHQVPLSRDALNAMTHEFNRYYKAKANISVGFAHFVKLLMVRLPQFYANLALLDTPGYSKADANATQSDAFIASHQLQTADYLIWVLSAKNGSIQQSDIDFLKNLNHPQPIFFVISQSDLVSPLSIGDIIEVTKKNLVTNGIRLAGVMAWAAPLDDIGQHIQGDNLTVYLETLNQTVKLTQKKASFSLYLNRLSTKNKEALTQTEKELALLNETLLFKDKLSNSTQKQLKHSIALTKSLQQTLKQQQQDWLEFNEKSLAYLNIILAETQEMTLNDLAKQRFEQAMQKNTPDWIQTIEEAAKLGCLDATYQLGLMYEQGEFFRKNYNQALSYYNFCAANHYPLAIVKLADSYINGNLNFPVDIEKGLSIYLNAADEHNIPEAAVALGHLYYTGDKIKTNYEEAFYWFSKASSQDNVEGLFWTAMLYYNGEGVEKDFRKSFLFFKQAALSKSAAASFEVGKMYFEGKGTSQDDKLARKYFNQAIFTSQEYYIKIGLYFYDNESYENALFWLEEGASKYDIAEAYFLLGTMYFEGKGTIQNHKNAIKWYTKAAEKNHTLAQNNLGEIYEEQGEYKNAFEVYTQAAKQGNIHACFRLGWFYEKGKGIAQNEDTALKWYSKAADLKKTM